MWWMKGMLVHVISYCVKNVKISKIFKTHCCHILESRCDDVTVTVTPVSYIVEYREFKNKIFSYDPWEFQSCL